MRVRVDLGGRGYDVVVAGGARHELAAAIAATGARRAAIVTTPAITAQPWFDLDPGVEHEVVVVPDGEAAKSLGVVESVAESLARMALSRRDVVVSVGGGATTDLGGFVAAVYARGVAAIHVPTSLVAQVDAAIGGKTGVDLAAGKNLVGAFHQPSMVLCDTETLATLPPREWRSGWGEVAKCWLLQGLRADALAGATLEERTLNAVRLKADLVARDEREGGPRALLNYGHTLGHALEALALARDPDELRHGEAVAIGLAYAVRLARRLGRVDDDVVDDTDAVLATLDLPTALPAGMDGDELLTFMARDKKATHDLTFVLPGADGFETVHDVPATAVIATLGEMTSGR